MPAISYVLVVSRDPLVSALVGFLVELSGFTPAFAEPGEEAASALTRVRPLLAVLLDADLDEVGSDLFFAVAARRRVALALFLSPHRADVRLPDRAAKRGIPSFVLPVGADTMTDVISAAVRAEWWRAPPERRTGVTRRSQPDPVPEGARAFRDRWGRRWFVFDRRGGDRRHPGADATVPAAPSPSGAREKRSVVLRRFVNEDGEIRDCPLTGRELRRTARSDLEAQLARAVAVP